MKHYTFIAIRVDGSRHDVHVEPDPQGTGHGDHLLHIAAPESGSTIDWGFLQVGPDPIDVADALIIARRLFSDEPSERDVERTAKGNWEYEPNCYWQSERGCLA